MEYKCIVEINERNLINTVKTMYSYILDIHTTIPQKYKMEPLTVVEAGDTIDITIRHSFPDIYSEAFFAIFGWNVSVSYVEEPSQNSTLTASGENTSPLLEKINSPTEPDNQTGFLNAFFGQESKTSGYRIFPLKSEEPQSDSSGLTKVSIQQPRPLKEKKSMIASLRDYASSFFTTSSSTYGTVETIQVRIQKHDTKKHHHHHHDENTNMFCLEQLFKIGLPSIYCFTGTSLTFEDIIDMKTDLQQQLRYMEKKGYTVSWLNVKHIYRIRGRYVLLSNKDEIKKVEQENADMGDIDSLVERLLNDFISSDEKISL